MRPYFPVTGEFAPVLAPRPPRSDEAVRRHSETVLVVEDEAGLRRVARRIFEKAGYKVLTAADGEEAFQVLAGQPAGIDLVFTDLHMPKLGGAALYRRVQAELGPMRFLVSSGDAGRGPEETRDLPADVPFVSKPWTFAELLDCVRGALDAPPCPGHIASRR